MKKIIGFTYDLKTDWIKNPNEPIDINAELDSPLTVERVTKSLEANGYQVKLIGHVSNLLKHIDQIKSEVDIVFNISEGKTRGRNRESEIPAVLEMHGIPFIGADALTLGVTLDKVAAKKMFVCDGIPTAKFFTVTPHDDLKKLFNESKLKFPLIVKTRWEGTSKGLTDSSRVVDFKGMKEQVEIIHKVYKQPALIEQFIKGTEFTVGVIGNQNPKALPVAQVCVDGKLNLGDSFFTYEMVSYKGLQYTCPAKISNRLAKQLQVLALRAYKSVDCRDFGRVDFRVDQKGNPYVLEINPLPSLAENDVFNIFPEVMGSSFDNLVGEIVDFALARYGLGADQTLESNAQKPCCVVGH